VGKLRAAVAAVAAIAALGCNPDTVVHKVGWFATMRHQRKIKPYARPIPPVDGIVPVSGGEPALTRETADRLANPRTRTAESLNRGQWVFQTYCQVCHGETGQGNGPVSLTGGGPLPGVPSLVDPARPHMTDGMIYGMIVDAQRMGRGLMPRYGDRIHGADRWDAVNYVRSLQLNARGTR
jgi:mono/diheme cytochrome c family protein